MTAQIKDMIAQEAAKTSNKVSLKAWCAADDIKFEKWLAEKFKAQYADSRYTLDITFKPVEEPDVAGKVQADVSKAADVFSFPDDQLRALVDTGCIAQVADLLNNNVIAENTDSSVEVCSIDGKPYAFPKTSDNGFFLYYDKRDLTDEDIATFDSIMTKANEKGKSVLYAMDNAWYNAGFFFAAGCTTEYDGSTQTTDFDSDKGLSAVKAMCHVAEFINKGLTPTGANADVLAGFRNGKLSAAVTGTWNGPGIREAIGPENLGASKLPTVLMDGEQKQLCSFGGYKVEGVNASTKFPVSAQVLAYFLTCPESQLKRYYGIQDESGQWMKNSKGVQLRRGFVPTATSDAMNKVETAYLKDAITAIGSDEAAQAIEAQRPFSQPQSNAGGKYWTPVGGIGGEIYTAKGNLSEADLQEKLKKVEQGFAG
jgi:arabinogalactan oligomer/maltooligosaccharide transport system substrate-binding protein